MKSFIFYIKFLLFQTSSISPVYGDYLLKYTSNWFTLLYFSAISIIILVIFEIIMDFSYNYTKTMEVFDCKIMIYLSLLLPSVIILLNKYCCLKRHHNGQSRNVAHFKLVNTIISTILTTFFVLMLVLKITIIQEQIDVFDENLIMLAINMEIFLATLIFIVFYLIFWVLTQSFLVKLLILFLHNLIIILFMTFHMKLNYFYLIKLVISVLLISTLMIIYSAYREKQVFDSYSANKQKDTIQKDWNNIVNDFPNGVILLSLKKNIIYLNKSANELLDLNTEPENYTAFDQTDNIKTNEPLNVPLNDLYETLVERIGKIEEVNPLQDSMHEVLNLYDFKQSEGFSIMESSEFTVNSEKSPINCKKKSILGCNPVQIISNSFPLKLHKQKSSSFCLKNDVFNKQTKSNGCSPSNSLKDNMKVANEMNYKEKKQHIFTPILEKTMTQKVDILQKEYTLDHIINKMRKKLKLSSKSTKIDEGLSPDVTTLQTNQIKTYCTQYKNFRESMPKNKKKYEIKIKSIVYKTETVFLITIQDVSYLDLVRELRENNEYKTKVLTTLSHELRTPLNGAITPLEKLIQDKTLEMNPIIKDFQVFKEIHVSYKSMLLLQSVLNDVVDFALINSNQLYLNYEEMNFSMFLKDTLDLFMQQADEKNLILELIFDPSKKIPKNFKTDFQRLRQILVSLLNNALKNTFEGCIKLFIDLVENPNQLPENEPKQNQIQSFQLEESVIPKENLPSQIHSYENEELVIPKKIQSFENEELVLQKLNLNKSSEVKSPTKKGKSPTKKGKSFSELASKKSEQYAASKPNFSSNLAKYVLHITVKDTGVGINEQKLENIRKCFASKDLLDVCANLNRKIGCGVGLTVSHCLALLLGPQDSQGLQIYSKHSEGTEVSFNLEGYLEKTSKNDSLSMIEENNHENSKYSTFLQNSTNYATRYSWMKKTNKTSNSLDLLVKKKELKKSETTVNIPNILIDNENELYKAESAHELKMNLSCCYHKNSTHLTDSDNRDYIPEFVTGHCLETHTETFHINKGIALNNNSQNDNQTTMKKKQKCHCEEVLIVDDDSFNILALESILRKFNIKSLKAFNGQQAIDIIVNKNSKGKCCENCCLFPLIFLDYHMPIKDGVETTKEIKKMVEEETIPDFPIIACTAFGAKDLVEAWALAGMSDFVVKPINFQNMERILRKWHLI